jgi:hypothetical protein
MSIEVEIKINGDYEWELRQVSGSIESLVDKWRELLEDERKTMSIRNRDRCTRPNPITVKSIIKHSAYNGVFNVICKIDYDQYFWYDGRHCCIGRSMKSITITDLEVYENLMDNRNHEWD